ncbi:MAG: ArnT family glycosyltransferase [Phycisphaerales bacterium]
MAESTPGHHDERPLARWRVWLVVGLLFVAWTPGLRSIPVTDRDEARFAQATRQMLSSGDFVRITFQDEPRHKKPAGVHWLQAATVGAATFVGIADAGDIWPYRIPSVIGGALAVLLTGWFARRLFDREVALLAAASLGLSALLVVETHLATTDAALLACVVATQGSMWRIYVGSRNDESIPGFAPYIMWAALGASILLKGPVGPIVALLTAASLVLADRRVGWIRHTRPLPGALVAAAIVAPWLIAVQRATDGAFLREAMGDDFFAKLREAVESHGGWPGYHLVLSPVTFWPGSIFAALGLALGWRRRGEPATRFLLAWLIPSWIAFELAPTKLPHYVLPLFPPLAILIAAAVAELESSVERLRSTPVRAGVVFWGLLTIGLSFSLGLLPRWTDGALWWSALIASGLLGLVAAIGVTTLAWRSRPRAAIWMATTTSAGVNLIAFGLIAPSIDAPWVSQRLATTLGPPSDQIVAVGYHEPSLVFEMNGQVGLVGPARAAELVRGRTGPLTVLVDDRRLDAFETALGERGVVPPPPSQRVDGLQYSKGRRTSVSIFQFAWTPAPSD